MPEPGPRPESSLSRLSRSPRALAAGAGVLLAAAVVIVIVVLVGHNGSSHKGYIQESKVGQITLPPANPHRQDLETIYTPGSEIFSDPTGIIEQAHALGFDAVKIPLAWASVAPDNTAHRAPHFDATDPAAYPAPAWAIYDTLLRLCAQDHLAVDLQFFPDPPRWAEGKGEPQPAIHPAEWNPDAAAFERFVQAVGTRYSGHYTPKGQHHALPRVGFWSIWNEPNVGALGISPQTIDHNTVESSPYHYRLLADAAWTGLHRTGHGHDTILLGELAPTAALGPQYPGLFAVMAPVRFVRALYCVGANDEPLRGQAATVRHCPATAAASNGFAAANPVLFHATAFSVHPYPQSLPPDEITPNGTGDAELAQMPSFFTTLDRLQQVYGSHRRLDVYDTEFGYQTNPPNVQSGYVTPKKAAVWLNWAEYISWRLPRMLSYDQYQFSDPLPVPHQPYTRYSTGLLTYKGKRKPAWYAFRMPIWLPTSTAAKGQRIEVWGCVRPAKNYAMSRRAPADIQFRPTSGGAWKTIATISTRTSHGYFDVPERFPSTGLVRIRWTPPSGPAMTSRSAPVTVR